MPRANTVRDDVGKVFFPCFFSSNFFLSPSLSLTKAQPFFSFNAATPERSQVRSNGGKRGGGVGYRWRSQVNSPSLVTRRPKPRPRPWKNLLAVPWNGVSRRKSVRICTRSATAFICLSHGDPERFGIRWGRFRPPRCEGERREMCARGMDAGINGDFEYLINESSKPAFEPSYFSRVSLSLSVCIFCFILILPLYILFFFAPARTNFIWRGYLRFSPNFRACIPFHSSRCLMKFYLRGGNFGKGELSSEIKGAVWQLSRFVKWMDYHANVTFNNEGR